MFASILVFVCFAISVSQSCFSRYCPTCPKTDLESNFNKASIVFRARILSGPRQEVITPKDDEQISVSFYDPNDVYIVKIVKIFKGEENVTQLPGIKFLGLRRTSIVIDFHTPAQWWKMCIPSLNNLKLGRELLLSGFIQEGTLRSSFCDMRYTWASVTHQQRQTLNERHSNDHVYER